MKREIIFYKKVMDYWFGEGTTHRLRKQIKFITRSLIHYKKSKKIANFIMGHKYLSEIIFDKHLVLCTVLHKPYMTHSLSAKEKVEISMNSYIYLDNFFTEEALEVLYENGRIKVLEVCGKENRKLTVYFRIFTNFAKEGEFNLHLFEGEKLLATLTFAIWNKILFIGGLQGLERENTSPEILKEVTKDFYGIFPKKLLLEVFYNLFSENKIAVGNSKHIYNALRYRFNEKRTVQADYDEFWQSLGGIKREDELWELPIKIERKKIEDIPSKKRSQYRKRYEILDDLEKKVENFKDKYCKNGGKMNYKIETLIDRTTVEKRIKEMAKEIEKEYKDKDLICVGLLKGSVIFLSDLIKEIDLPLLIDFMNVSSYGNETTSSGTIKILKDTDIDVRNKHILIVEDIIDSGYTLDYVIKLFKAKGVASVKTTTLLTKPERRKVEVPIDYVGFEVPDKFVVGYGLDYAQKHRNLPYIGAVIFEEEK